MTQKNISNDAIEVCPLKNQSNVQQLDGIQVQVVWLSLFLDSQLCSLTK